VHYIFEKRFADYGLIAYPGALFPTNFHDLEKYSRGGFYIVDVEEKDGEFIEKTEWKPIQVINTHHIKIDCNNKTPKQVEEEIYDEIENKEFIKTIVTMRLEGRLKQGKGTDIDFKGIYGMLFDKSAYYIMKSLSRLSSEEFENVDTDIESDSVEEVEKNIVKEHLGQIKVEGMDAEKEEELMHKLIHALSAEKDEGERVIDFENRVVDEVEKVLE